MAITTCKYCRLMYDDHADRAKHTRWHRKFTVAETLLGSLPASSEQRASMKALAYKQMANGVTFQEKVDGALLLHRAHFDWSLETAIANGYHTQHPSFSEYIAMTEYPHGTIAVEIMKAVREIYGHKPGHIPRGKSYWYPLKSNARKRQIQKL